MSKTFDKGVKNLFISHQEQLSDFTAIRDEIRKKRTTPLGAFFFSKFTLSVIDLYLALIAAKDFYAGEKQIALIETPAARMISEHNLIEQLDSHRQNPINLIRAFRISTLDNSTLPYALSSLLSLLRGLCSLKYQTSLSTNLSELDGFLYQFGNLDGEELSELESSGIYNDFTDFLDSLALDLKDLQTKLQLIEHDIYDEHPDWDVIFYDREDEPFDAREDRKNQSRACHTYFEKYGNPLSDFENAARNLSSNYDGIKRSLASVGQKTLPALERLIATPVIISYQSPLNAILSCGREDRIEGSLNPWLREAKQGFVNALHLFFKRLESEKPKDSSERDFVKSMSVKLYAAQCDNVPIEVSVNEPQSIKSDLEVIPPAALVTTADNQLSELPADATSAQKATFMLQLITAKGVMDVAKTMKRIDERSRNRTVAREEKLARWAMEDRLLKIFDDYKADKHGPNLNKGKRAIKDLLIHEQLGPMIERAFGITSLKPLKTAITRARVRREEAKTKARGKRKK